MFFCRKKNKEIVFFNGTFVAIGGIEKFTADLALLLLKNHFRVKVICAALPNAYLREIRKNGGKIVRVPWLWGCRWGIPSLLLLPAAVWSTFFSNVIIYQKIFPWFFPLLIGRKAKNVFCSSYNPKEEFPDPQKVSRFFSFFHTFLTQSRGFLEGIARIRFQGETAVIPLLPPPVMESEICRKKSDGVLKIGMFGRLENQKNPLYALEIVKAVAEQWEKPVEFHVYGDGAMHSCVQQKAETLKVNCFLHGAYEHSDLARMMKEIHLCLIPSFTEGQCIAALEMLALGCPVFATPVGALPEILQNHPVRGGIVPFGDAGAAASIIVTYLKESVEFDGLQIARDYELDFKRTDVEKKYVDKMNELCQ